MKRQVIVVGAGPGGSTAAFYLAKLGVDVLLVDKETWPKEKICGGVYLPILFPFFEEMGCLQEILDSNMADITRYHLISRNEDVLDLPVQPFLVMDRRFGDDCIRRSALAAGADFMDNYEATSLIMKKGVVKGVHGLYHNKPMDLEADVVIIANGAHSELSRQLGAFMESPMYVHYCFRAFFDNLTGVTPGTAEEFYIPKGIDAWSAMCTTWICPQSEDGSKAIVGLTIPEHTLREANMTIDAFFQHWLDVSEIAKVRFQKATIIDQFRGWRLPGSTKLMQSVYPGTIIIGDAISSAEVAFDYGIPTAMTGGKIAAEVIRKCVDENDFSYEALNRYQPLAEAALNPGLEFNALFHGELLNKEEVMEDFFRWAKSRPDYPNFFFDAAAIEYMKTVLHLDINLSENNLSQ